MIDLEKLKSFFTYTVKIWLPDDEAAWKEYNNFKATFMAEKELARRSAAYCSDYELGAVEGSIGTELPVIIYYDSKDMPLSHEIYQGKLPSNFIRRKWKNMREHGDSH